MLWRRLVAPIIICSLPLAMAACVKKESDDPRTETPLVLTAIVKKAAPSARSFTGIVEARVQSNLGFRVSGKVLARLVDAGQTVKRGQVLMRIDPVDLRLAARAQLEAVTAARAHAQQTAADEDRYRDLRGTDAISSSTYDQVKAAADAAKAQLSAAEARADVARNETRYTELKADADGVVMDTLAEPGQVVSAGQIVIRLAHAGSREADIQLPETLRPAIGSMAQATSYGSNGITTPARLRQLSDTADHFTRTFEARYVLSGNLADAPIGSTVVIRIPDDHPAIQSALQVPIGSLFDAGKGPGVWVVNGKPKTVSWRPVSIQSLDDESARIISQIKQGDRIVALGAHLLREGEQVRVGVQSIAAATEGVQP